MLEQVRGLLGESVSGAQLLEDTALSRGVSEAELRVLWGSQAGHTPTSLPQDPPPSPPPSLPASPPTSPSTSPRPSPSMSSPPPSLPASPPTTSAPARAPSPGPIPSLLRLLGCMHERVGEEVAKVLASMCCSCSRCAGTIAQLVAGGAAPPLLAVLQRCALDTEVPESLGPGVQEALSEYQTWHLKRVVDALRSFLAASWGQAQLSTAVGTLPAIMQLLDCGCEELQQGTALDLANVCSSTAGARAALAGAGAVSALERLLGSVSGHLTQVQCGRRLQRLLANRQSKAAEASSSSQSPAGPIKSGLLLVPGYNRCNPLVEEQAMDQVHRLGQSRAVEALWSIARDPIEERRLQLQERKRALASAAFERSRPADARSMRIDDVKMLMRL